MDGQIGLFDKKTNFDVLMSCQTPEQFMRLYEEKFNHGCRQKDSETWKKLCLSEEYRGMEGCKRCKLAFWNMEYIE